MTKLRPGVTEADALIYINTYLARHELGSLARSTWGENIRPLLEQDGACWKSGGVILCDVVAVQHWAEYIAKRRVLARMDIPGWHAKRPYSLEDMYNLVDVGVFDGEIDHPLFSPATEG